jgi:hypothetical protein
VGRFDQRPRDIAVEAYGRRGRSEPLAHRVFTMRDYGPGLPEFVDRFEPCAGPFTSQMKCNEFL